MYISSGVGGYLFQNVFPSEKGSTLKGKNLLHRGRGTNYFIGEKTPIQMEPCVQKNRIMVENRDGDIISRNSKNEQQCQKSAYLRTSAPSEDSRSLIRIFTWHILDHQGCNGS